MAEETAAKALNPAVRGLPEEIVVWEILVRLPARSLLRCRAVCRSFRRITSTDDFLLAHHRHQPCLPLVSRVHGSGQDLLAFDYRAFPADSSTTATASARLLHVAPLRRTGFHVRASCDGLLVISLLDPVSFYVCNPATRQWSLLPFLPNFLGFYPHRPSGEYRLLYDHAAAYYLLTVGSRNGRCIGRPVAPATSKEESATVDEALAKGLVKRGMYQPSVLLHGDLHIYPVKDEINNTKMVMVFSATTESFRWMRAPTVPNLHDSLFEMNGKLALSSSSDGVVLDVSVLQDYQSEAWELKYSIVLPLAWKGLRTHQHQHFVAMFLCEGGVVACNSKQLLHVDIEGRALANLRYHDQSLLAVPHRLKESLANHPFFPTEQNDGDHALLSPFI